MYSTLKLKSSYWKNVETSWVIEMVFGSSIATRVGGHMRHPKVSIGYESLTYVFLII